MEDNTLTTEPEVKPEIDAIHAQIKARMEELRPLVEENDKLERAAEALRKIK